MNDDGIPIASKGRVIAVRPRPNGYFSVTLGPPPDMWSFICPIPPRLGELVEFWGRVVGKVEVGTDTLRGTLSTIRGAKFEVVEEAYSVRVVADVWEKRAQDVMRRTMYRYQRLGAGWLASRIAANQGSLLCDDPGLGKTTQAISALCATNAFPAIICCPASLKTQWAREFAHAVAPLIVSVVAGGKGPLERAGVYIINYEILRRRAVQLVMLKPRAIVFDECQALKEPKPTLKHRARIATDIVLACRCPVVGLTGTPILNRTPELWRLLHILDPRAWDSFEDYRRRYCGAKPKKGQEDVQPERLKGRSLVTNVGKVEEIDELFARVSPYCFRRLKHQVLTDLPSKRRNTVVVRLGDQEMQHYRKAEKDVVEWLKSLGHDLRAQRAARAQQVVRLTMLRRIAALAKLQHAIPEYLAQWFDRTTKEPLVIFGYHRDLMTGVQRVCQNLGLRITGIGGGEPMHKRQAQVDLFMSGWGDVFLAPINTAGVGLNLQRASDALFLERVWTPALLIQAEDRLHRIGQQRPVTITYLDAEDTVDEHLREVLSAKQQIVRAVVDAEVDTSHDEFSVQLVDMVADRLRRR